LKEANRVIVKRASIRDFDILREHRSALHEELRHRTKLEHRNGDRAYGRFLVEMTKKRRLVGFLAFVNNDLAGSACVWLRESTPNPVRNQLRFYPYLLSMYTIPRYRNNGVATAIIMEAKKWSKDHGQPTLLLHASEMGRQVYSKLGFTDTHEMRIRV
jgi:GNAT superfamily N-acetyltransferase